MPSRGRRFWVAVVKVHATSRCVKRRAETAVQERSLSWARMRCFELALRAEQELGRSSLAVAGLGAERTIRIAQREKACDWLEAYYDRVLERRHAA